MLLSLHPSLLVLLNLATYGLHCHSGHFFKDLRPVSNGDLPRVNSKTPLDHFRLWITSRWHSFLRLVDRKSLIDRMLSIADRDNWWLPEAILQLMTLKCMTLSFFDWLSALNIALSNNLILDRTLSSTELSYACYHMHMLLRISLFL